MIRKNSPQFEPVTIVPLLGGVIPHSLAGSPLVTDVHNRILTPDVNLYVAVPPGMGVVERWPSPAGFAGPIHHLKRGFREIALNLEGEAITLAVVRLDIRFLELDNSCLAMLCTDLKGALHWFKGGALCARDEGGLFKRPGPSLMCARPLEWIRSRLPAEGLFMDGSAPMALTHALEHEIKFDLTNVFMDSSRLEERLEAVGRAESADDLHRLSEGMPAVHHLYRVAKQYSIMLSSLSRGRARRDEERLSLLRDKVEKSLKAYGPPFDTKKCLHHCFRVIDPKQVWGRGAGATSFHDAFHTLVAQDAQFRDEESLSLAMRVLIMVARSALASRGKVDVIWPRSHGGVIGQLEKLGFKGEELTAILAKILMAKRRRPGAPGGLPKP